MDNTPRQVLKELIATHGPTLTDNPQRCKGLLLDRCQAQRLEVNLLTDALEEHVHTDLRQASVTPYPVLQARLVKRLQDNKGTAEDKARWAVDSWALALGVIQVEPTPPKTTSLVSPPPPPIRPAPVTTSAPPPPKPVILEAAPPPPTPVAFNAAPPLPKPVPAKPAPQPVVISANQVASRQSMGGFCLGKFLILCMIAGVLAVWASTNWTGIIGNENITGFFLIMLVLGVIGLFAKRK